MNESHKNNNKHYKATARKCKKSLQIKFKKKNGKRITKKYINLCKRVRSNFVYKVYKQPPLSSNHSSAALQECAKGVGCAQCKRRVPLLLCHLSFGVMCANFGKKF